MTLRNSFCNLFYCLKFVVEAYISCVNIESGGIRAGKNKGHDLQIACVLFPQIHRKVFTSCYTEGILPAALVQSWELVS